MSRTCNREACQLRLERVAAGAKLLAKDINRHIWYSEALEQARAIAADANNVLEQIENDKSWEAGDR